MCWHRVKRPGNRQARWYRRNLYSCPCSLRGTRIFLFHPKRGNAYAFLCIVSSFSETSYISGDDHFAALQIDLCVRGWIEGLWRNRRLHHSHQFPNYVCSIKRDSTSSKRTPFIILLPLRKNKRRGNFRSRGARHYTFTCTLY